VRRRSPTPSETEFERLLAFRLALRRFLRWSEEQAAAEGVTSTQYELLLAIRGHRGEAGPTIGELAETLVLRHNSAVGLVDRAADAGLVTRGIDPDDHRVVRVRLTRRGDACIGRLARAHLAQLPALAGPVEQAAAIATRGGRT